MCTKCSNTKCTNGNICCKKAKRGPAGPRGPKGDPGKDGSGASIALYKRIGPDLVFDKELGTVDGYINLPFNTSTVYPGLEIVIPEDGDYIAFLDYSLLSGYDLEINSQIVRGSSGVSESVRGFYVDGGTPPTATNRYGSVTPIYGATAGETINAMFKSLGIGGGSPSPGSIYITVATLSLIKVTMQ